MGRDTDKEFKISKEHNINSPWRSKCDCIGTFLEFSKPVNCMAEQQQFDFDIWTLKKFQNKALIFTE